MIIALIDLNTRKEVSLIEVPEFKRISHITGYSHFTVYEDTDYWKRFKEIVKHALLLSENLEAQLQYIIVNAQKHCALLNNSLKLLVGTDKAYKDFYADLVEIAELQLKEGR